MSISPLPRTSASTMEPRRMRFHRERAGLPMTILLTLRARADELACLRARADADEDALGHRPGLGDGVVAHVGLHLRVYAIGGTPQGELTQGDEIALAEEVVDRLPRLLGHVDL